MHFWLKAIEEYTPVLHHFSSGCKNVGWSVTDNKTKTAAKLLFALLMVNVGNVL
jgi:hypothetical protein